MAKHTEIEGYSVIVFVPVGAAGRRRTRMLPTAAEAKREADAIRDQIHRHLQQFAYDTVDVEEQVNATCEHCGMRWTEKSDTYNGNCCDADEEAEQQRKRDNSQLGVGA